jgi:serine/threonine protein kinase
MESGESLAEVEAEVTREARGKAPYTVDIDALAPVHVIGFGAHGGVWLAVDSKTGRKCAVKQVRKGRAIEYTMAKAATRALTERGALISVCGHPFITTCYATFQNETSLFFALELAPQGDLFMLLEQHPDGLPEMSVRFYCACVALALKWVHAQGWVSRDVKLKNILVDSRGYALLCDFGVAARRVKGETGPASSDEWPAFDWWALGISLTELLAESPTSQAARSFLTSLLPSHFGSHRSFINVQAQPWLDGVAWEAMLRREVEPPPLEGSSAPEIAAHELTEKEVMRIHPYDRARWDPIFAPFGPYRRQPWRVGGGLTV